MPRVLLVEDDAHTVEILTFALQRAGFEPIHVASGPAALQCVQDAAPDIILLDVGLTGMSGFDVLREIRQHSSVPVIMLTARDEEPDKVRGLELGADDYVTKPFSYREVIARLTAVLRRVAADSVDRAATQGPLRAGPLALDTRTHSVTMNGMPIRLTRTEFRLLQCLMQRPGTVVPQRLLLRDVWGPAYVRDSSLLRPVVYRLRRKLEGGTADEELLRTIPGVGLLLMAGGLGGEPHVHHSPAVRGVTATAP
ncbi:MAG TPA: response regulator transcription factor [Chloroflexota bacterium]|nr:response regulator transcription factor [Chloroflexota bacterium]